MTYWFNDKDRFINPYNFVEIDQDNCDRHSFEHYGSGHTGVIECELITRTPLIIPDHEQRKNQGEKHFEYPFMKLNGQYAIPGSSIRGPVRSIYETLTNSCFRTLKSGTNITARGSEPLQAGLLIREKDGWALYEAERCMIPVFEKLFNAKRKPREVVGRFWFHEADLRKFHFGQKVSFTYYWGGYGGTRKYADSINGTGRRDKKSVVETGYIKIGEGFSQKHFESIFVKKALVTRNQEALETSWGLFRNTIEVYQDDAVNRNLKTGHKGYREYPEDLRGAKTGTVIPIYYKDHGSGYYLSPANVGRFTFFKTENCLAGKLDPCVDRKEICPACALFGMIAGSSSDGGYGSKVRFSDAYAKKPEPYTEKYELCELASPHVSYLPFYAKRNHFDVTGYDDDLCGIRGRKYYWHFEPERSYFENKSARNERNAKMEILGGSGEHEERFTFNVWFDDISKEQLNDLVWTLTLGENSEDSSRCLKIGHAKPFGFGSCKIIVTSVKERSFENGNYVQMPLDAEDMIGEWYKANASTCETSSYKRLMNILTFGFVRGFFEYPSVVAMPDAEVRRKNDLASHNWFSENYKFGSSTASYYLPEIPISNDEETDISLPRVYFGERPPRGQEPERKLPEPTEQKEEKSEAHSIAPRAVWVSKNRLSENAEQSFRKRSGFAGEIDQRAEYPDKMNLNVLKKEYTVLLVEQPRKQSAPYLLKMNDARKAMDEIWIYDSSTKRWDKKQ